MASSFGPFRPDAAGIRSIFTGGAMQGAVREATEALAAEANAVASEHHLEHKPVEGELYQGRVGVGYGTAMGFVGPVGRLGHLDQAVHHTLDQINH